MTLNQAAKLAATTAMFNHEMELFRAAQDASPSDVDIENHNI